MKIIEFFFMNTSYFKIYNFRGRSEVTKILEWTKEDHVYYIGTEQDKPGTRQLYRLELGQPEPDCLTCHHKMMMQELKHRPGGLLRNVLKYLELVKVVTN